MEQRLVQGDAIPQEVYKAPLCERRRASEGATRHSMYQPVVAVNLEKSKQLLANERIR